MSKNAKTTEQAFYEMVGGPDAMITREAGLPVITRLLAMQAREVCGVNPQAIDDGTMELIQSVDAFYGIKPGKFTEPAGSQANSAKRIFEVAALPKEALDEIRHNLDQILGAVKDGGVESGSSTDEQRASVLSRNLVATKIKMSGF